MPVECDVVIEEWGEDTAKDKNKNEISLLRLDMSVDCVFIS